MKILFSLFIFITPQFLIAASEVSATPNWIDLLYKSINFIAVIGAIIYFARKPIGKMLSKSLTQKKEIYDNVISNEKSTQEELEKQIKQFQEIEKEIEELSKKALENIEKEKKEMLEQARQQAVKMEKQTEERIKFMLMNAKQEIRTYIVDEAFKLSNEKLRQDLKSNNIDKIINKLPSFYILNK